MTFQPRVPVTGSIVSRTVAKLSGKRGDYGVADCEKKDWNCPFVVDDTDKTLAELFFNVDPVLEGYAAKFVEEAITPDLAMDLQVADLQVLLPGVPLGHILALRRAIANRTKMTPKIPSAPAWQFPARALAKAQIEGGIKETLLIASEFNLIGASLFMGASLSFMLSPTKACADGSACTALRSADVIFWALSTFFFTFSVCCTWISNLGAGWLMCVSDKSAVKHIFDTYGHTVQGGIMFVFGVTVMWPAFATRSAILYLGSPDYPDAVGYVVIGLCAAGLIGEWAFYAVGAVRNMGEEIKGSGFFAYQGGVMGYLLPRKLIQKGTKKNDDIPYFDYH